MSFSFDSFQGVGRVFPLRGDHDPIVLDDEGIRHPRNQRARSMMHTAYEDVTHLAASSRVLWLGTRDSVYLLPRAGFQSYDAPELLVQALLEQIASRPDGDAQLARIAAVESISHNAGVPIVTRVLIGICIAVFVLQQWLGNRIDLAAELIPALVSDGDLYRVVTANLLHAPGVAGIFHLGINMLALLPLGTMVERPLGATRTICVMLMAGVGSMLTATTFSDARVVGASGIVFGLAGAVLWLDYRSSDELPAWWRFPRRNLIGLILINGVLGAVLPFIAFAAHAGGLAFGALAAAIVTGKIPSPAPLTMRIASGLALGVAVLAVGTAAIEVTASGDPAARYAQRVSRLPDISPDALNDIAWVMATSTNPPPTESVLLGALSLAERAVSETGRSEPTILDTLAEVHFLLGNTDTAVSIIEEAISHDPEEPYFQEQRRRFTGERAPDDRPDYIPPMLRGDPRFDPNAEDRPAPGREDPDEPYGVDPGLSV